MNLKAVSIFLGHSGIQVTLDVYGHLLPGSEEEAAGLLDALPRPGETRPRGWPQVVV